MRITHNGNLVLLNATSEKVWQSFSHLTDTLLDGQYLTVKKRYKVGWCPLDKSSKETQHNSDTVKNGVFECCCNTLCDTEIKTDLFEVLESMDGSLMSTGSQGKNCTCPESFDGSQYFEPIKSQFPNRGCRLLARDTPSQDVLTLMTSPKPLEYYSSLHMRVPNSHVNVPIPSPYPPPSSSSSHSNSSRLNLLVTFACLLVLLMIIVCVLVLQKRKIDDCLDHGLLEQVSSEILIKRFSYHELYVATKNSPKSWGKAVLERCLKGFLRVEEKFLAEMATLGNTHHINLVKLIGFCVDRNHRMLVFEYMSKGSLHKWIFSGDQDATLHWNMRKKIATDIAKGLMYLHEECRHKIAHLDVKPHNILLDANFNAKISDFGMSKLINREESQVNSRITVKADVHSFGIVLLEIICGRKILDYSQPHSEHVHMLSLLEQNTLENRLMDVVECQGEDMKDHVEEAIDMMRLGMWCSDGDYTKRPSMS
ncbi:G-type lectin S-receptor-like serine/threonine-protein kinase SD2-5 [Morus notabilis]|uniref:non-specific serine/threonine protein kinase n=1 Tax=Morus notabilis TaxID=981085 RepID=W9S2M4_9ROSA|nr:G-type lectin S-receptor-like serine/threonine-protein kinase SD2-5 [Morus notabilis]